MVPPQNVTVNVSQDAFLACQAEAYPGNLTYTWFQGSSNVFHLRYSRDGDSTEAAAGSCWRCCCGPAKLGSEGDGLAACVAEGFDRPRAVGTVPAAPLTTALPFPCSRLQARVRVLVDGSLLLQRTTPDDAGKYTCIPSNGLWKPPSASAFVTVLCKSPAASRKHRLRSRKGPAGTARGGSPRKPWWEGGTFQLPQGSQPPAALAQAPAPCLSLQIRRR